MEPALLLRMPPGMELEHLHSMFPQPGKLPDRCMSQWRYRFPEQCMVQRRRIVEYTYTLPKPGMEPEWFQCRLPSRGQCRLA